MTYRGDDEPEYIDDDEYYDPDEYGGRRAAKSGGRKPPRVLGGSFRGGGDDKAGAARNKKPPAPTPRKPTARRVKRPAARAAPATNERRSRPAAPKGESRSPKDANRETEKSTGGRLSSLRGRLAGGSIRGRLGNLRGRGQSRQEQAAPGRRPRSQSARPGKPTASSAGRARQSAARDAAPNRPERARRARANKRPIFASGDWLDLDRKLDLLGVGLVFGAIALFFSTLSQEHAAISAVHDFIDQLLGWGALAVPIAMFAVGMWLIVRHFGDRAPVIDPIRLAGVAIAFAGLLTFFQYVDSFGYVAAIPDAMRTQQVECAMRTAGRNACEQEVARLAECQMAVTAGCLQELVQYAWQRGQGGGYVGGWLYLTLVNNVTEIGGFVILVMMLTFSAMMMTRSSMAEMAVAGIGMGRSFRSGMAQRAARRRARRLQAQQTAQLRISKPDAARLPGAAQPARALPKPDPDTNMPLPPMPAMPIGERGFSRRRGESFAEAESERESTMLGRLLSRGKGKTAAGGAGLMGRLLNRDESGKTPPAKGRAADKAAAPSTPAAAMPPPAAQSPAPQTTDRHSPARPEDIARTVKVERPRKKAPDKTKQALSSKPETPRRRVRWKLPDYGSLLSGGSTEDVDREELMNQTRVIEETLASFGAPGRIVEINTGPVITQFGVEPDYLTMRSGKKSRVKVSAIAQLDKDLQLALGAKSIRVEAPVPGKGYVGIEVPNPSAALVSLRDIMESENFRKIKSPLAIALGRSVDGVPISADLTQMPHLLIAGTTGSGKSVCVNAIINSIIAINSPDAVKFIMVDPKRVELTGYNGLPHLIAPVVVELERIVGVLKWVTREMDERYKKFSNVGARHLVDYNKNRDAGFEPMPYIVVIIDELADLMMLAPEDTERAVTRIAALARATGIHLVIATQRPSVDVVTGLIKANFPARIAFAVAGSVDSRVILDQPGAERLLGTGDMLYLSGDSPAPLRLQGVYVSDEEIRNISRYWMAQQPNMTPARPISIEAPPQTAASSPAAPVDEPSGQASFWDMTGRAVEGKTGSPDPQEDALYQTAVEMVRRLDKASVSLLQRRLRIGYTRAARLMDMMEERGVVGPPKEGSSKPRDVMPE